MRLRYWRAARAIRSSITTLVWLAGLTLQACLAG